jgi:hypothetical protein
LETRKKRKNYKKMAASLSALGAGALLGTATADASIVYSGPVNQVVGFGPGTSSSWLSTPLAPSSPQFSFYAFSSAFGPYHFRGIYGTACGCVGFGFLTSAGFLKIFDKGAVWPVGGTYTSSGYARVAGRAFSDGSSSGYIGGLPAFNDKYALFAFEGDPGTLYGWVHLSLAITQAPGGDPALGPNLTILDWAYEDSGQTLAAGDAPEPATAIPTGLGALALGAVGLRNWRKTRKAA